MAYKIVIEGIDGSGKNTQSHLLKERLEGLGYSVALISFPDYDDNSGKVILDYLKDNYKSSDDPLTSAIQIGSLYATNRLVTFMKKDEDGLNFFDKEDQYDFIIFDRYTTSNQLHQSANMYTKIKDIFTDEERRFSFISGYLNWVNSYEFDTIKLPRYDLCVYLTNNPSNSIENINKRSDIDHVGDKHETLEHLTDAKKVESYVISYLGWKTVISTDGDKMRDKHDISCDVYKILKDVLNHKEGK